MIEDHFSGYSLEFKIGEWGDEPESNETKVVTLQEVVDLIQKAFQQIKAKELSIWVFPADRISVEAYFSERPTISGDKDYITINYRGEMIGKAAKQENCHVSGPDNGFDIDCITYSGKLYADIRLGPGSLEFDFSLEEQPSDFDIDAYIRQALQDGVDELTKPCFTRPS